MQTDSSASITYLASASASEWIATVLMPISRHARWMRSAISPRLAINIFSNIAKTHPTLGPSPVGEGSGEGHRRLRLLDQEKRLAVFHRLAVLHQDRLDRPRDVRLDLVEELHRLDDAEGLALGDGLADLDEGRRAGRGRAIERPHHGRLERVARGLLGLRGAGFRGRGRGLRHGP